MGIFTAFFSPPSMHSWHPQGRAGHPQDLTARSFTKRCATLPQYLYRHTQHRLNGNGLWPPMVTEPILTSRLILRWIIAPLIFLQCTGQQTDDIIIGRKEHQTKTAVKAAMVSPWIFSGTGRPITASISKDHLSPSSAGRQAAG